MQTGFGGETACGVDGAESALVSVIVPVYNAQQHLNQLIRSFEGSSYRYIEVIIVDDASEPPTQLPETSLSVSLLRNERNIGKAYSVNRGARIAAGQYLVVMDPDIEPATDLLKTWVEELDIDSKVGVAGAYVYFRETPRRITHAGALMSKRTRFLIRRLRNAVDLGLSQSGFRSPHLVLDDIYIVRAEAWKRVGGFDDANFDAMFEDADLQKRIAALGYDIAIIPNAKAYHAEDARAGSLPSAAWVNRVLTGYKLRALPRSRLVFLRKHKLVSRPVLYLNGFLLLCGYGILALAGVGSLQRRLNRLGVVLRAVADGMLRQIKTAD